MFLDTHNTEPVSGSHPSTGGPVRAAPSIILPSAPRERVAIGIDGAETTGLGVWRVPAPNALAVELHGPAAVGNFRGAYTLKLGAAGWSEEDTIAILDAAIGDAEWFVVLEGLFLKSQGQDGKRRGRPPAHARKHLSRAVDLLARRRADRAGVAFRKPSVVQPMPDSWRATIGVNAYVARCRGDTKAAAIQFLRDVLGVVIEEHNAAEGACLAYYGTRVARAPIVPKLGGPVEFVR